MNKDGLKKIYLIKSAGYEFSEIDLSDNTLLLGESGVGKTTIMRAVLFFYTMDYSDAALNINPDTKKSFNQWYFKEHNSHVVYEYTKGESRFLFIVNRGVKLHYTFVDMTNATLGVKDLFLEGDMPVDLEKLNENIQTNNLPNYDTTKIEKYINTFHVKDSDNRKIKQDSITNFTLFENINSTKEFAKTLSNIFASSKVSSSSVKKSIVSLIDDSSARLNLNEIKLNLSSFISEKLEIEKFEKKMPTIEKLSTLHNSYKASKKEFKTKANYLEKLKQDSSIKLEENKNELLLMESQKEKLNIDFKVASEITREKISLKENEISVERSQIDGLSKKDTEYKKKNIDHLLLEDVKEQTYNNELIHAVGRFEALTSGSENIKQKYLKIKEKLHSDSVVSVQTIKTKIGEKIDSINLEINDIIQTKESKIEHSSRKYKNHKISLESQLEIDNHTFHEIKISLAKVEHFPYNKTYIDQYEKEMKQFENELSQTIPLITKNTHDITKVEEEIKNIEIKLSDSTHKLDEKITKEKDLLFEQKSDIEKKLDFESPNLYGFLNKNNIKHKQRILTYLKDEILFSDRKFSAKQVVHDSAILGLEIEFEEEFSNEYQQVKLLNQLSLIKERIKYLNKKAQNDKKNLEEIAQLDTKEKNRQRASLYALKSELQEKEKSYKKGMELAKENLKEARQRASQERKKNQERLQKEYAKQEQLIQKLELEITTISKQIQDITDTITQTTNETIVSYKEQIQAHHISKKSDIENIKAKYRDDSKGVEDELSEALKDEGVDDKLLAEISTLKKSLESKLEKITKNKSFVIVYISEFQEMIKTIPLRVENLRSEEKFRDELKSELKELKSKNKEENQKLETMKKILDDSKSALEKFLEKYSEKIENQNIAQSIKNSLALDMPNSVTLDIADIVDDIIGLYNTIKNDEDKMKAYVLECFQALKDDNIFRIKKERDYIDSYSYLKTAKELISYKENDKISVFKDISSQGFKSSLNSIRKELGIFEDAILDVESEIMNLKNTINKAVNSFVVIDSIKIRFEKSNNNILNSLIDLSKFYDDNNEKFLSGLFSADMNDNSTQKIKEELGSRITDLVEMLKTSKEYIELEDGFVLEFKVTEKGNDLKWRQTLSDIGSNGTSTLVKSIINISMLQMVSKNIVRDNKILTHCILDEIGTISTDYFRELKDFVNRSGFVFLNGMPIEDDMLISMYPTIYVGQNQGNYSRMILASKMEI